MKRLFTIFLVLMVSMAASANGVTNEPKGSMVTEPGEARIEATVWQVGPTRTYKKPSEVAALVQDGDIIEIDAADYVGDVASWTKNNLTIRGVGGMVNLDADFKARQRKAIWVISGSNTTVENIKFQNCRDLTDVDKNWAGIRQEGAGLIVRNCIFYKNSNGILSGKNLASNIDIQYTIFDENGHGDGQSHNLYIGEVNSLYFAHNYSAKAVDGHNLKSRATHNYILYNRISDEDGTPARSIDLPNGGIAVIMGNLLQQGPNVSQRNIIGYGLENLGHGPQELYVVNNTVVNEHGNVAVFVDAGRYTELVKAYNNIFAGRHNVDPNAHFVYRSESTVKDLSNNLFKQDVADAGLADAENMNYHLLPGSEAIGAGTDAGMTSHGFSLTPVYEYVHTANKIERQDACNISLGAYEYGTSEPEVVQIAADKSVVYYGYAPEATATLSASATSDRAPLQYNWNTGDTTETISVSPTATTTYTVTVTDVVGCEHTDTVTVEVIDVRCGPAQHQKVVVCNRAGREVCVDANAVPAHLNNGGTLGNCNLSTVERVAVSVYPNPFSDIVTIELSTRNAGYVVFEVRDFQGSLVKRLFEGYLEPGQVKHLQLDGTQLNPGLHVGKIITKEGVQTLKLMVKKDR